MKKLFVFTAVVMMMAFITAINAEARPGGMPDLSGDRAIKDCSCPPCCTQSPEKATVRLNVLFDTNKADIKPKYHKDIETIANFMKLNPNLNITIEGHTDNVGKAEDNQVLSDKRANAVRQYLIDKFGISGSRLTAVGYGQTKPIADNATEKGRMINRRTQAVFDVTMIRNSTVLNKTKATKK